MKKHKLEIKLKKSATYKQIVDEFDKALKKMSDDEFFNLVFNSQLTPVEIATFEQLEKALMKVKNRKLQGTY